MNTTNTNITNKPSRLLGYLSKPNFLKEGAELGLNKKGLYIDNKQFRILSESNDKIKNIAYTFITKFNSDISKFSGELNTQNINSNLDAVKSHLQGRVKDKNCQTAIAKSFANAKQNVGKLQKEESQSNYNGINRRITRYALYLLYTHGCFEYLSSKISLPTMINKATVGIGSFFAATGSGLGSAATVTGGGFSFAAGAISSVWANWLPGLLTFLAITEGPGVVGHLARRLTPDPVKNVYSTVTPSIVQKAVNFVFHTDKLIERTLDTGLQSLAILLG